MASIGNSWATQTQIIGTGDGWVTLSGTTPTESGDVDLETDNYVGAVITPEVDFDSTPTDYVDVKVYWSLDGTNYSDTPDQTLRIDKATDPNQRTMKVWDVPHFKVAMVQTGSTDSHNVRCYCQRVEGITA
jgi:hypothetical protein